MTEEEILYVGNGDIEEIATDVDEILEDTEEIQEIAEDTDEILERIDSNMKLLVAAQRGIWAIILLWIIDKIFIYGIVRL